jgi:ParB-like chromosome segregation protein Spo0J
MKEVKVEQVDVKKLKSSSVHGKVYTERKVDTLANSMNTFGQLEPIVITKDFTIISGVLRVMAAD